MPQTTEIVRHLLLRELGALKREIAAFPDDAGPWQTRPGVTNTAGTLALHCAGNLQHFIGAKLGGTGYVRQRDLEFSRRDVPRAELLAELDRAMEAVGTLAGMSDKDVPSVYPDAFGGKPVDTGYMLVQLAVHIAYHLGQVDYYRRLVTGDNTAINAVAAADLPPATSASD
jgi:hypothetical protein